MALSLKDRVRETTTIVGTGTATLLGAATGCQAFSTVGNGNTTYYCISDQGGANWEVGIGTYTSAGTTLARTTVLSSSNAGALVVFTAGTKDVFVTYPAEKSVNLDASGNATGLGIPAAFVGTNITGTAAGLTAGNATLAANVTTNANLTGAVTSIGNATSLGSFTSTNLATALTDETGSGANVFATSPTLVTPALGTPTSGTLTNCTLPQLSASTGSSLVSTTQSGTGSVTRTVASKLKDAVSVKDFGAMGDNVTDDTAAIQAALNSCIYGGKVILLPGTYKTGSLTFPSGVGLVGDGAYASTLMYTGVSGTLAFMNSASFVKNLKLTASTPQNTGYYLNIQGNGVSVENCDFDNYYIGVNVGEIGGLMAIGVRVENCNFCDPSISTASSGAILFVNYSNAIVDNCIISGTSIGTTQPYFGIRYINGDTAFLSNTNITLHGHALLIGPTSGLNCYAISIDNCIFDSAGSMLGGASASSAYIGAAGGVFNTRISNSWFGLSLAASGCHIGPTGSGVVDGITFTGCEFTDNGESGLLVASTNVKNWSVTGGFSCGNTDSGIRAAAGVSNFVITGHNAGNISARGANNYGIKIDSGASDNYLISQNLVVGNTIASISDSGTGSTARVVDNVGYNSVANNTGLTVGASPWTYISKHTPEVIYVVGGILTELRVDGNIVQNTTNSTLVLAPNETMSVTYSDLPTISTKRL